MADTYNHQIRKISVDGTVSIVAGTGKCGYLDGKVEEALIGGCYGVAVGEDGSIYFSDSSSHVIRRVKDGEVSTLAGKAGEEGNVDGKGEEADMR